MTERRRSTPTFSIVIPIYNEPDDVIVHLLDWIDNKASEDVEWIFAFSEADPEKPWKKLPQIPSMLQVFAATGRSSQLNKGAEAASGETIVFLHADTKLPNSWLDDLNAFNSSQYHWGAFSPAIEANGLIYRMAEAWGRWRTKILGIPYGDQAIFIKSSTFRSAGGFDTETAFMEELDLCSRLKAQKRISLFLDHAACTSARKWQSAGCLRTSCVNVLAFMMYFCGIPRSSIKKLYHSLLPR